MTAVRIIVEGHMQGVGFRAWVKREAVARGLSGWVRNRADGSVEAIFSGEAADIAAMVESCRLGPRNAVVRAIRQELVQDAPMSGFSVHQTV